MRKVIILYLTHSSLGQTTHLIDSLVSVIDGTTFSDSVVVDTSQHSGIGTVIGYMSTDSILKVLVVTDSSVYYTLYFWYFDSGYNELIYANEKDNSVERKFYFVDDTVIIGTERHWIYENSSIYDLKYKFLHYCYLIEFQVIDNEAEKYLFVGELVEIPSGIKSCGGVLPSGAAFKYRVIETDYVDYKNEFVIICTPCPPLYGEDFFIPGSLYRIKAATNSGVDYSIGIRDDYYKESTPKFWPRRIEKIQ